MSKEELKRLDAQPNPFNFSERVTQTVKIIHKVRDFPKSINQYLVNDIYRLVPLAEGIKRGLILRKTNFLQLLVKKSHIQKCYIYIFFSNFII